MTNDEKTQLIQVLQQSADLAIAVTELIRMMEDGPIDYSSGVCCCGSSMEDHGMGDNHSPVDSGRYYLDNQISRIKELLK